MPFFVRYFWFFTKDLSYEFPILGRFNIKGGASLTPEFLALWIGLTTSTSTYIAEVVRSGLSSVDKGQYEAAKTLGFSPIKSMTKVIIPQAIFAMVPALTSQYLNIIKNTSLSLVIGFGEIMGTIGGSSLNITGQAIECIVLVMITYCLFSLVISFLMNLYNRHIGQKIKGR